MGTQSKAAPRRNRIVGEAMVPPGEISPNALNWRTHPKEQLAALGGLLNEVGWVQRVVVNQRTGNLIDGHARLELALQAKEPEIPVVYVDLSEREERLVLATLDPIGGLAGKDIDQLAELLQLVETEDEGLAALLDTLKDEAGLGVNPTGLPDLASGEKEPFQQMSFIVHDEQKEIIDRAIERSKKLGPFENPINENSNGNALARICEIFLMKVGEHGDE